jgi:hypothetical protein
VVAVSFGQPALSALTLGFALWVDSGPAPLQPLAGEDTEGQVSSGRRRAKLSLGTTPRTRQLCLWVPDS